MMRLLHKKRQGQTLVEFAITALVFAALITGMFGYFLFLQYRMALDSATLHAARDISIQVKPPGEGRSPETVIQELETEFYNSFASRAQGTFLDVSKVKLKVSIGDVVQLYPGDNRFYTYEFQIETSYPTELPFIFTNATITARSNVYTVFEQVNVKI